MRHPSFDIISKLEQSEFCRPDLRQLALFRADVWHMRVFIPGERIDMHDQQVATLFNLTRGTGKQYPRLPLYIHEVDVVKAHGQGAYFAATFDLAMLFAESYRIDIQLHERDDAILIPHEKLLDLRDMVGLGHEGEAMDEAESRAQRKAMIAFAIRARSYCSKQADVNALHLATLMEPGLKSMLIGRLRADHHARHALALKEISKEVFLPGWRFMMLEETGGHPVITKDMNAAPPCYARVEGQSWWKRMTSALDAPVLPLIGLH